MRTRNYVFAAVVLALLFSGYSLAEGVEKKQGIIFNDDNGHFFGPADKEEKMTVEGLHEYVDLYAGTQISQMFFCVNAERTVYNSKVWNNLAELDENDLSEHEGMLNEVRKAHLLDKRGIDPFKVLIEACRKKGISPCMTMRMNDVHHMTDISHPRHSDFWRQHPEYWRVVPPNKSPIVNHWERALDYEHKEVRDYNMKLIREILERYDIDALELDWMREPYCFSPGREKIGLDILTEFMRQVRQLTKESSVKRGHPIQLTVRVPVTPQTAEGFGLDAIKWAKLGLVDMLVLTPRNLTTDFDIPIELWRQLLGDAANHVKIATCLEVRVQPCYWGTVYNYNDAITNTIETACAFAAAMLDRGADHIYTFNNFEGSFDTKNSETPFPMDRKQYRNYLSSIGQMSTVIDKPRRHIVTFPDLVPPGTAIQNLLPATLRQEPRQFRMYTGPKPTKGKAIIRVGLDKKPKQKFLKKLFSPLSNLLGKKDDDNRTELVAKLNSVLCERIENHESPEQFHSARVAQFEIPLDTMQRGYNLAEVASNKNDIGQNIVWVEIYIVP